MHLCITDELFTQFPDTFLGVIVAHDLDNMGDNAEISALLRTAETNIAETMGDAVLIEHPHIAPWRAAYRHFGAKPKKYPSSIENLVRRTLKGQQVRHINKLVDIYNVISLRHIVPVGGEDLDVIQGNVQLTIAGENEAPVRLLGEPEERPPNPGEVLYKDDVGAICRRWNWKEADRTKLTEGTRHAVLVIEGLPPVTRTVVQNAMAELADLIETYCGGNITATLLDSNLSEIGL